MKIKYHNIFLISLFASCSTLDSGKIAPGYFEAYKSFKSLIVGYPSDQITPELIKNIPYASSTLRIGRGPMGLLILESTKNGKDTWVSQDGVYIIIKEGRIIESAGLSNNLINLEFSSSLKDFKKEEAELVYNHYYSYDFPSLNNLKVRVSFTKKDNQLITLINKEIKLTLIEERIINDYLGWDVTNKYWLDEEGYVWKSEQHISPKLPPLFIEITKKPT